MCPCGRWSGNRTRNTRYLKPMLYPIELSSGDGPDSNRCTQRELMPCLSAIRRVVEHLLPIPGIRHGSAARTGQATSLRRCGPFERCSALASRRRGQSVCNASRAPPVPKHQGTAHPCACAAFPASGQHARMPRERDAIALILWWVLCERRNGNAPGCWNPRAFALPREIGATDLRDGRGSVDGVGAEVVPHPACMRKRDAPFARAQASIALGR